MIDEVTAAVVARTLRVPAVQGPAGDGAARARQLDVALMQAGFKLSGELLAHLSGSAPATVADAGADLLTVVQRLVGDHVRHNVYFREFPAGVPDTVDFWLHCIGEALADPAAAAVVLPQLAGGVVNLLDLPAYGRYRHTYEQMVAAHALLIPTLKDRCTLLQLGGPPDAERRDLYLGLASSPVPLSADDLALLGLLADRYLDGDQPATVPVREHRAVVNRVRLDAGRPLLLDTVTDVLRLAGSCG